MNEILRKQIWRKLESLPDDKAYQVLDYLEFLESRYGGDAANPSGFQRFGELFQDKLRRRKVPASALRETMRVMGAADRVFGAFRDAGREFVAELEGGRAEPSVPGRDEQPPRTREIVIE